MFPYPTSVLDHRLAVTPDALFGIVVDFVRPLLGEPVKAQGPGDWYFAVTGVKWDAEHKTINVNAMEYIPQERSAEEEWVDGDGIVHVSIPASGRHTGLPMPIVSVTVTPLSDEKLTARIVAAPGTDGEQYAIRLAGHIIRATGGNAAYKDWVEWVKVQTEPTPAQGGEEGAGNLPPVTDPTDQRILTFVTEDPDLTDQAIGQQLGISRQAANTRRCKLKAMGYTVR